MKKPKSWLENKNLSLCSRTLLLARARNKIAEARKVLKPRSARFYRATKKFGSLGVVILIALPILGSFFLPKNQFQQAKEKLVNSPLDYEAHLVLAEEFLKNNQFEEAEKELLLAQNVSNSKVLGLSSKLADLWQKKHYSDPKDIRKLITSWEQIVNAKPNYRDGYLQLAFLYYKIQEDTKAKENLSKALELDPNFEPARQLQNVLK